MCWNKVKYMGHIVIARSSDLLKSIFIKILYIKFINKNFNILIYISCKNMLKVFIADKKGTFFFAYSKRTTNNKF